MYNGHGHIMYIKSRQDRSKSSVTGKERVSLTTRAAIEHGYRVELDGLE